MWNSILDLGKRLASSVGQVAMLYGQNTRNRNIVIIVIKSSLGGETIKGTQPTAGRSFSIRLSSPSKFIATHHFISFLSHFFSPTFLWHFQLPTSKTYHLLIPSNNFIGNYGIALLFFILNVDRLNFQILKLHRDRQLVWLLKFRSAFKSLIILFRTWNEYYLDIIRECERMWEFRILYILIFK